MPPDPFGSSIVVNMVNYLVGLIIMLAFLTLILTTNISGERGTGFEFSDHRHSRNYGPTEIRR